MSKFPPIEIEVTRKKRGKNVHYEAKVIFKSDLIVPKDAEKNPEATEFEMRGEIARQISTSLLKFVSNYRNDKFKMNLNIGKPSIGQRIKKLFKRS